LGAPRLIMDVSADQPVALLAARLSAIAADGRVQRVSYGVLNLTHRGGHTHPVPLAPGKRQRIEVRLNDIAHSFAPGERLRVALSTGYWPLLWPSPRAATLTVYTGASSLVLPVRAPHAMDSTLAPMPPPECGVPTPVTLLKSGQFTRQQTIDLNSSEHCLSIDGQGGIFGEGVYHLQEIDLTVEHSLRRDFRIMPDDPLSARLSIDQSYAMRRQDWNVRIVTRTLMQASEAVFELTGRLEAYEGDSKVFGRDWNRSIPRRLV
jgi:hypothetical protein